MVADAKENANRQSVRRKTLDVVQEEDILKVKSRLKMSKSCRGRSCGNFREKLKDCGELVGSYLGMQSLFVRVFSIYIFQTDSLLAEEREDRELIKQSLDNNSATL
jgi:hypothetical protein